ncbi:hypothetical protein M4951_16480 [Blastopirellula sp. J2-11]|uniref:hypothetical protein n=1 Tax=Blastopirellula sp. J2-11 TaxID=2943192 RepID=UPI0021C5AEBE|nr:hypothetical protein [Blastopirellula sp. J2-11]UUO04976.1 hypothetical protein M4951_16480 [Blastopirellula sp. J2-11]
MDKYGSVVAKHPDIWGESRLMRHRAEYEQIMETQLGGFEVRMNAALRRSDQAFLGMAFALQAAVNGEQSAPGLFGRGSTTATGSTTTTVQNLISDPSVVTGTGEDGKAMSVISRTAPFGGTQFEFGNDTLALEPTLQLDQMSRYLNHLHELRRINEGDDIADSPGYSLNLVRIPVSILPGGHTREGYGAEITVIAEPYLGEDLLPTTFRSLVTNDLVDLLSPALASIVNEPSIIARSESILKMRQEAANTNDLEKRDQLWKKANIESRQLGDGVDLQEQIHIYLPSSRSRRARLPLPPSQIAQVFGSGNLLNVAIDIRRRLGGVSAENRIIHEMDIRGYLTGEVQAAYEMLSAAEKADLWHLFAPGLATAIRQRDVQGISKRRCNFNNAIASTGGVLSEGSPYGAKCACDIDFFNPCLDVTTAMAWAVIVESALLDEKLAQDMREIGSAKGCMECAEAVGPFYGPNPHDQARYAFNEYVRCRWPIRVFALDPANQEQNITDEFSRRRELQVAIALAFAGGEIGVQTLMNYTRRLESDMATIDLNRTVVGFSHGNDTFGWRFNPRFQTPPFRGNLATFGETLFGGPSEDADLRKRQLEPGMRECTAIVVMPSFVPFMTFDVRSNWYHLTHPKQTDPSMHETMKLSRSIKSMQQLAMTCGQCAHLYRDGEVSRLLRRVDQLERELPLQTMRAQIPYENTTGGFELFSSGITDLAPELIGWYGEPGVNRNGPTTLFLMGDGFSVHETQLTAGGRPVPFKLLSRQVMQATIPPGVQFVRSEPGSQTNFEEAVDLHVATPYGVSSHLHVPVAVPNAASVNQALAFAEPVAVSMKATAKEGDNDKYTVDIEDFSLIEPGVITLNSPALLQLTDEPQIRFQLDHDGVLVGSTPSKVSGFDPRSNTFYIEGADLKSLVGSDNAPTPSGMQQQINPYIKYLVEETNLADDSTISIRARAFVITNPLRAAVEIQNPLTIRVKVDREDTKPAAAAMGN